VLAILVLHFILNRQSFRFDNLGKKWPHLGVCALHSSTRNYPTKPGRLLAWSIAAGSRIYHHIELLLPLSDFAGWDIRISALILTINTPTDLVSSQTPCVAGFNS
jgi:hypothetical protein